MNKDRILAKERCVASSHDGCYLTHETNKITWERVLIREKKVLSLSKTHKRKRNGYYLLGKSGVVEENVLTTYNLIKGWIK